MSALRIDQLRPGDVLYDVRRERAGHTAMSRTSWYRVVVVSVDTVTWTITARWHHIVLTKRQKEYFDRLTSAEADAEAISIRRQIGSIALAGTNAARAKIEELEARLAYLTQTKEARHAS